MTLENAISSACETNAELSEFNFKWIINNVDVCLKENIESSEFETEEGVYWKLYLTPPAWNSKYLQATLKLERSSRPLIQAKIEYFLLTSSDEIKLNEPYFQSFKGLDTTSTDLTKTLNEMLYKKTGPNGGTLTFVCRIITKLGKIVTKVTSGPITGSTVPPSQMPQDFAAILENKLLADVTLVVEGKHLKAHKAILAARSPVFAAMFTIDMVENQRDQVVITDMDYEVAQQMLRFIYTDKAQIEPKVAHRLLAAADKYSLMKLKAECEIIIGDNLTASTAVETLTLADRHGASQLKSRTLQFIQANSGKVLEGGDFKSMIVQLYQALDDTK